MTEDDPATTGGEPLLPDPQQESVIDHASALEGLDPWVLLAQAASSGPAPTPTGRWMPPPMEEISGLLTGYQITALLGRGGMGAVYRGLQVSLDRQVAIKLLPPELGIDPEFEARFKREAKSMAKLNHSNIVQIYDFGQTTAGHYYFVMEYVDGCDLHQLIRDGLLDVEGALNAVSQICDALQYAHDMGFVHRDIKPANIFINQQGILKVGDFGLAKLVGGNDAGNDNDLAGLTGSGIALGTMHYIAPEQLAEGMVDRRADIYSLGVMFYQMLTRELPRGAVKEPSKRVAMLDVRIDGVVFKAMDPDPDDRYQSAADFRTDVDRIRLTPPAVTEAAGEKIQSGPTASGKFDRGSGRRADGRRILVRPPEPAATRGPRRNGGARVMTVFAGLAIIGGLAWWVSSQTVKTTEMEGEAALGFQQTERLISVETTPLESAPVAEEPVVVSKLPVSEAQEHPPEAAPPVPTKPTITITATKDAPFVNSLGMKFVPVPIIGGPTDQQHLPFSVWETRVQDYEAFVKETNRARPAPDIAQTGLHPVVNLRYEDAVAFCAWLTEKEQKAGKLGAHQRYRLPTDHEWTCAVGLGKAEDSAATPEAKNWKIAMYPWGRQYPPSVGAGNYYGAETKTNPAGGIVTSLHSYDDGFERTAPVGSFAANELGLYDLGGNVSEWCADWFDGGKATKRVLRGASWGFHYSNDLLSSNRYGVAPNFWNLDVGFRVVLDPGANPDAEDAAAPAALTQLSNIAEAGFIPLLEAPQLAGWREQGPGGGVSVTDSVVTLKPGRNFSGAWWYGARTFSDFQLRLQFRLATPDANSGVMLRFARRDEKKEPHYDVDISNDPNPLERTGAIMFVKAPTANPQKDGEWNDLDITATGQSYRVLVNGILVNEYTGGRSTSGYIGLQLGRGTVQIRQLRIKDLAAAPTLSIPQQNSDAAAKVVRLRSDFQAEAKSLDAPILALNTKYREYLETQKTAFQQAGNLKGVLAVDEELKRFEGTATGRADSPFGELKRLQEIYYKQKIELRQKKQNQYINLVRVYQQKAEDMASESTKAGRIEEAKQALAESDKFTAMEKAGEPPPMSIETSKASPPASPQLSIGNPSAASKTAPFINSLGMKFVPIPGTRLLFCIHETRRQDYSEYSLQVPGVNGIWKAMAYQGAPAGHEDNHPVAGVSWDDAVLFCQWLSKKEQLNYRLPTDGEWSMAARLNEKGTANTTPEMLDGLNQTQFPWGEEQKLKTGGKLGNYVDTTYIETFKPDPKYLEGLFTTGYTDGFSTTAPVMSFLPNDIGLYDMGGNVREFCADWSNAAKKWRVMRGSSSQGFRREDLLTGGRSHILPDSRLNGDCGFRCVIDLLPTQ